MIWNPFSLSSENFLGVDIGTSAVKIVEISRMGNRKKLENYGEMQSSFLYEKPFRTFEKSTLTVTSNDVVRAILAILKEANMKAAKACFSIPDFSTFFTTFQLPSMTEAEVPSAVQYEARQYIPLPLSEVTLDWQIVGKKMDSQKKSGDFNILLVAVPNEVIQQYQNIAAASKLELIALEAEVFSLNRALAAGAESAVALIDMGARSTTISIIDKGFLRLSHSSDTAGSDFTNLIVRSLDVDYETAEKNKRQEGLSPVILPMVDLIINEVRKISQSFFRTDNKEPQKIILAGGSALLPGLADYFSKELDKTTEIANPFASLYYPPILEGTLKEMGPSYAIAVGAALRCLE